MAIDKIAKLDLDSSGKALYLQLADDIRRLIRDGEISPGDVLPSERRMRDLTGTSRVTIRRAIQQLTSEGLLSSRRGAGTYINHGIEQRSDDLSSFTEYAKDHGDDSASVWLIKAVAVPTQDEAKHLQVGISEPVVRLGRLRLLNGEPLAIEHAVVPLFMIGDLESIDNSLYSTLRKNGYSPAKGNQKIRASLATPTESGLLSIGEGSEVLRIVQRRQLCFHNGFALFKFRLSTDSGLAQYFKTNWS